MAVLHKKKLSAGEGGDGDGQLLIVLNFELVIDGDGLVADGLGRDDTPAQDSLGLVGSD